MADRQQVDTWRKHLRGSMPPVMRELGVEIVEASIDFARVRMPAAERWRNAFGTLHGGILAALADVAMGLALAGRLRDGERFTTMDLHLRFLRPVEGGPVTAEARVRRLGSRSGVCEVTLFGGDRNAVAVGSCACLRLEGSPCA